MLHGMQKVRGSNPLSSTGLPDVRSIAKCQAQVPKCSWLLHCLRLVLLVVGPVARGSTEPLAASASKG